MKDWQIKKLKDCCIGSGKYGLNAPSVKYSDKLPKYIRITDINENGIYNNVDKVSVDVNDCSNFILKNGDILFARTGATVGKSYLYNEKDGIIVYAGYLIKFKPNPLILKPKFLSYFTFTKKYYKWIKIFSSRSGQPGINAEEYGNLKIPVPPLAEQEKIVSILSKQDEVIEKLEDLIELKVKQKNGLMQKLLSGKVRLSGFDGEWGNVKLRDIISEISEKTTVNNQYDILSITKQGIVPQKLFFDKQVASENNVGYKIVLKDNIVFSSMNLWMGSIGFCEYQNGIVSPAYKVFKINNKYGIFNFLKYYMKTKKFINLYNINSRLGASKVRKNLDLELLLESNIKIPTLEEQSAIASILSKCDEEIELLKKKLELNKKQKKWLMQKLLSGEIRVKEV